MSICGTASHILGMQGITSSYTLDNACSIHAVLKVQHINKVHTRVVLSAQLTKACGYLGLKP